MDGFSPEMFVTPTRAHPQQYADPSPPFIDDHRYYNVEGKVKLFRRSGARKNLLNMYYQTPVFGQQPPGYGQASSSSFRVWKDAEKSKISPYLKNKVSGKYHSMPNQSPKVKSKFIFFS